MSRKARKFKAFFRPKLGDLQKKKKKKVFTKIEAAISSNFANSDVLRGGCFRMGGLFSIFHTKSASKAQKACDFAYFTSQWGGLEPPRPPYIGYYSYTLYATTLYATAPTYTGSYSSLPKVSCFLTSTVNLFDSSLFISDFWSRSWGVARPVDFCGVFSHFIPRKGLGNINTL